MKEAVQNQTFGERLTNKVSGALNIKNRSNVPIGTGQPLPKRHIILPVKQTSVVPAYLQDPESPTKHPSRCEKNRAAMLDNLTKYLTKAVEKDQTASRQ